MLPDDHKEKGGVSNPCRHALGCTKQSNYGPPKDGLFAQALKDIAQFVGKAWCGEEHCPPSLWQFCVLNSHPCPYEDPATGRRCQTAAMICDATAFAAALITLNWTPGMKAPTIAQLRKAGLVLSCKKHAKAAGINIPRNADPRVIYCANCKGTQATRAAKDGDVQSMCGKCCAILGLKDWVDVTHKRCAFPLCDTRVNDFTLCAPHDEKRTKVSGEAIAKRYLHSKLLQEEGWEIIHNTAQRNECSDTTHEDEMGDKKYRPDFIIRNDLKYPGKVFVCEHDEDQHDMYQITCEDSRAWEVLERTRQETNSPILFCRVNPDFYSVAGESKRRQGWVTKKKGSDGYDFKAEMIEERYDAVLKHMMAYFEREEHVVQVEYTKFFYDNDLDDDIMQQFELKGVEKCAEGFLLNLERFYE